MKLPASAHASRSWRIHEIAPDFRLEDVWALPTPGGPDDLHRLVAQFASTTFPEGAPRLVRALWAARWRLGAWFGWDEPTTGVGTRVASLRDRLPDDLTKDAAGHDLPADHPFTSVYLLDDEYAAELANKTVHAVVHLGWVSEGAGGHRGQMAVLVKPNGPLGALYLAAIEPVRHRFVYPALLRAFGRSWRDPEGDVAPRGG